MSNGTIRNFKSTQARDNFEKVASAYAHGWAGPKGGNAKAAPSSK